MTAKKMIDELSRYCGSTSCTNCVLMGDNRRCLWLFESEKLNVDCSDLYKLEKGREVVNKLYSLINPPIVFADEQSYLNIFR